MKAKEVYKIASECMLKLIKYCNNELFLSKLSAYPVSCSELDYSLRIVGLWLSVYMTGAINQYYYLFACDKLHRRTIIVSLGEIALFSSSVDGQYESFETILTTESSVVANHDKAYDLLLKRCRQAMIVHPDDKPGDLLDCLVGIAAIESNGI